MRKQKLMQQLLGVVLLYFFMICCCSQIPVPSLIREFCDFSRGFLWCQSYTEEIREYFYGVLIHSSDFQTSEQGIKCCPMNINWYTTYYVREIWHNINTQMKHSNTETNYCLDIKTVSKKKQLQLWHSHCDFSMLILANYYFILQISHAKPFKMRYSSSQYHNPI